VLELKAHTLSRLITFTRPLPALRITAFECLSDFDRPRQLGQPLFRNVGTIVNNAIQTV